MGNLIEFQAARGEDGKVRSGVWDLVCVPSGVDRKDGMETEFNVETMSQMIDNVVERGDLIGLDYNHQSQNSSRNGQPAPALAWYGAFAVVDSGKIVKAGACRGIDPDQIALTGIDMSKNGLWAYRSEVTEMGDKLLTGFKYTSPTFTPEGTKRDGTPCGYSLIAVAATNSPFQEGTQISFAQKDPAAGLYRVKGNFNNITQRNGILNDLFFAWTTLQEISLKEVVVEGQFRKNEPLPNGVTVEKIITNSNEVGATTKNEEKKKMSKLSRFAKIIGMEEGADDAETKKALECKMEDTAMAAASDDKFDYAGEAGKFEEAAQAYEDAHMEDSDDDEPPHATMRKMAAKFRKLAKMSEAAEAAEPPAKMEGEAEMAKLENDDKKDDKAEAKMATMEASLKATQAQLASLQAAETAREEIAKKEKEAVYEQLASQAVDGGYPKEAKGKLIEFARVDLEGARACVASFLPKSNSPAHIFDRMSAHGAPIGKGGDARSEAGAYKPRQVTSMGHTFIETDGEFADVVKKLAESKDPVEMAKLDKYIPESQRSILFNRLLAADKVVRAERPELAKAAE